MNRLLLHLRDRGAAYLTGVCVIALVAVDIARAVGWDWKDVAATVAGLFPDRSTGREVRNYVEFTMVSAGPFQVVTGIQFDSSLNGLVSKQWCYVEPADDTPGKVELKLTLGTAKGTEPPVPGKFSVENLRPFGLTAEAALLLMNSHCRFRTGGKTAHV